MRRPHELRAPMRLYVTGRTVTWRRAANGSLQTLVDGDYAPLTPEESEDMESQLDGRRVCLWRGAHRFHELYSDAGCGDCGAREGEE
jgi:hypothetical protein